MDDTFLFQVENLSKRGLWVNGERLQQHDFRVLTSGDTVCLAGGEGGETVGFVFHDVRSNTVDLLERPSHNILLRG